MIDTDYFPDAHASEYWSSTTLTGNGPLPAYVNFPGGYLWHRNKVFGHAVRCVRGGQWVGYLIIWLLFRSHQHENEWRFC